MRGLVERSPEKAELGVRWDTVASRCGVLQRPGLPSRGQEAAVLPSGVLLHANAGFEMVLGKEAGLGELWIGGGKCLTPTSVSVDEARRAHSLALSLSLPQPAPPRCPQVWRRELIYCIPVLAS